MIHLQNWKDKHWFNSINPRIKLSIKLSAWKDSVNVLEFVISLFLSIPSAYWSFGGKTVFIVCNYTKILLSVMSSSTWIQQIKACFGNLPVIVHIYRFQLNLQNVISGWRL